MQRELAQPLQQNLGYIPLLDLLKQSWSQPIIENGLIIGGTFIVWRIWVTKDLLLLSLNSVKKGNYLPIFLFGACAPVLLTGIYGQPTSLGFAAFGLGLCLASTKE